jgi:autotransporter-associated beta strand protein
MVWTQPDSTSWNEPYYSGDSALFTGSGTGTVTISGTVTPLSVNVSAGNYTFSGGSLTTTGDIYVTSTGSLTLSNNVTVGNTRVFGLGTTTSASTSAMVVDSGVLNVGAGGGAVMIGGGAGTAQSGKGSLVINGGTVNVGAAGTTAQGVDASKLWLNGYGLAGSSGRIDLNGGMLSTARTIENGSLYSGSPVVNLNGGTLQAAGAIDLIAAVTTPGFVRRTTVNVLSGGAIIDTQAFNASISEILRDGGGGGGLTKAGLGTLTLTGINTYTGNTTVNAGTLSITSASLADASTVTIANSAMLNLNFDQWGDVSDTVANLIIGTTQMAAGVYGATGSGATSIDDTHFSGVGTLTVTSGPYDTWANGTHSPALTAKLFGDNQDGDSLNNLLEFAFGTQPTVSTGEIAYAAGTLTTPGAPKVVAASGTYSMVFGRRADDVTAGLIYKVQFSADLDTWVDNDDGTNPPVQVATDGTINAMSVPFVALITTPSGSQKPTFSRVKVESTAPPPLPPPFPIESWALSNDDTSITLAVTSDNKLVMNQLMDPTDGWNWTGNSTYLPMLTKAKVGSTTYNLKWVYNTATTDTSSGTKLTIKFTSQTPNIELWDEWWVRPGKGPVRHCAHVVNNSGSVLTVYNNDMFNMKVSGSGDSGKKLYMWYIHDDGSHPDATGVYKNTILDHTFTKQIDATVNQDYIPYVVLDKEGQRGIYFGAEWSTLRMNVSGVNFSGVTGANVKFGERNDGWSANVSPGSAFAYPPGFVGVYKGDIDDGGNSLRPYLFNYCIPASIRDDTTYPKVEWNAFAATGVSQGSWSSTETKYYPFIDDIAPLGFESVVLDVGWWGSTAPMEPNYLAGPLWPSGILAARNYAKNKGMLFGLYQNEPENMSTEAGRNERIADWSYLHNAYGADFVRSDATGGGPVISGNDDYSATKGFYDVLDTLYSTVPGFQYENCNGGGSLKDFGIMKRMSNIFNTDYYTPLLVRQAFYDSSFAMHPMQLSGVVGSGSGQWSDGSVYDLRSSSMGAAYWFADGPNGGNGGPVWSAQHKTDIAKFVTSYKTKIRPLVRNANLYHIFPRPTNTIWDGVEYYNPATGKGCVYIFRPESCSISSQSIILKGLDTAKNYALSFEDGTNATVSKSGSELMSTGISVTLNSAKLSEIMWID